jgi:phosphate-selective porin
VRAGDLKFEPVGIKNKDKGFELKLGGYVQFDFRHFNWDVEDPTFRNDNADIRRVRTGIDLEWRKLKVSFDLDWTEPARDWVGDGNPPYAGAEVKNAYVNYEFSKAFELRAGAFKPPVGYEFLTSAGRTDFVERAMLSNVLGPDRDYGLMAMGELHKRFTYQVGVFAGDARTAFQSAETTFATRLGYTPWKPLDVQASFSRGNVEAEPEVPGGDPSPKGFLGRGPSGWRFYDRKFVNGARTRWGADAQYTRGSFQLKAEFLQAREERKGQGSTFQDLPVEVGNGWSATATYVLTGEKKQRSLKAKRPLTKGGPGLIEIAAK